MLRPPTPIASRPVGLQPTDFDPWASTDPGRRLASSVDCMVTAPDIGGRRRALRSWIGLVDRGYLGPAGVTVEHANGRLGSRPHTIRRADHEQMFIKMSAICARFQGHGVLET